MSGPDDKLRRVRLRPAWHNQYPVWVDLPEYDVPRNIPTEQLIERFGVSADIVAEIDAWDREWQDIYRHDDPRESGFADEATMYRWYGRGLRVARRLAGELGPEITVEVVKHGGGFLVAGSAPEVSYFGSVPLGRTRGRPAGVFRRTIVDGQPVDETFTRNLRACTHGPRSVSIPTCTCPAASSPGSSPSCAPIIACSRAIPATPSDRPALASVRPAASISSTS